MDWSSVGIGLLGFFFAGFVVVIGIFRTSGATGFMIAACVVMMSVDAVTLAYVIVTIGHLLHLFQCGENGFCRSNKTLKWLWTRFRKFDGNLPLIPLCFHDANGIRHRRPCG